MTVTIRVEHDGVQYAGEVMTITHTRLGWEDHGILTANLTCSTKGAGVSVGGFCLDKHVERGCDRRGTAYGLDHLMQIMLTVGVDKWEDLKGREVIVLSTGDGGWGSSSLGIAGLTNGRVLLLQEHAMAWQLVEPS